MENIQWLNNKPQQEATKKIKQAIDIIINCGQLLKTEGEVRTTKGQKPTNPASQ